MNGIQKKKIRQHLIRLYRPGITAIRRATWSQRAFPELIIIGAQKAGTTSLFNYLSHHPQLAPSLKKEVHYFDGGLDKETDNFSKGEAWYRSNFPLKLRLNTNSKAFEASPFYLYHPQAAERIFQRAPESKLIVVLRNPTERAISHYFHELRNGSETLPMIQALQLEEERLQPILESKNYKNEHLRQYSYKSRGRYLEQLNVYFKYFDKNNIHIINSESFFSEPQRTLQKVYKFANVDTNYIVKNIRPMNVGTNKSQVSNTVRHYLIDYFKPFNEELYKELGKKYDWDTL